MKSKSTAELKPATYLQLNACDRPHAWNQKQRKPGAPHALTTTDTDIDDDSDEEQNIATMLSSVNYYCPCMSTTALPPPPHLPSSSASYHQLHTLYFCEECDAIRCNRCVSVEVSGYYCPNCLFEVPSASVRSERNRCARNCFQCPHCCNTLSVVPSDPPEAVFNATSSVTPGEAPYLLYCNNCRWDSAEVGISFEKPTMLAQQLQRTEDSAPEFLEFERLKDFYEPIFRFSLSASQQGPSASHGSYANAMLAASNSFARDMGKYNAARHRSAKGKASNKEAKKDDKDMNKDAHLHQDDFPVYKARLEADGGSGLGAGGDGEVNTISSLREPSIISKLEQRWTSSWADSTYEKDLKPIRIPLHSRLTKRCPACRHILIKPEQKTQSVRYKIKLVAANYLPAIQIALAQTPPARRASVAQKDDDGATMLAGKTYPFLVALTNPLYDPINVRLAVQRQQVSTQGVSNTNEASSGVPSTPTPAHRRPAFAISLPTSSFAIAPYAEAWEYDDDDEMLGLEDEDMNVSGVSSSPTKGRGRTKTVGVLEKKANTTVVGGEVVLSREGRGDVKFNMLVSYTYRADEPQDETEGDRRTPKSAPETKTFSFYTVIHLGAIVPKEEVIPVEMT